MKPLIALSFIPLLLTVFSACRNNDACPPWQPTIGEACFEIIQSEVEGNWPKAYRSHYTFTAGNVGEWWESRRTMSLKDLQLDAATTSLERARHKGDADAIRFLEEHLKEVQSGRCCPDGIGLK